MKRKRKGVKQVRAARTKIPAEEFVKVWQKSPTLSEAKSVLGVSAGSRAGMLRAKGVPLKKFQRGQQYDYKKLAAVAKASA